MKVLGVHSMTHDLGTALCIDGEIKYAVEEERLSRIKHHSGIEVEGQPPRLSLEWILKESNLKLQDIDKIVHVGWPGDNFMRLDIIRERYRKFAAELDPDNKKSSFVDHHRAHAASSFFASGMDKALVLAVDGQGDWISTSLYLGDRKTLKKIDEYFVDQSLGFMFSRASRILGLGEFGFGEGKLTALAGYGNPIPNFPKPIILENGRYRISEGYYEKTFLQFKTKKEDITQAHKDFGATIQKELEDTIKYILTVAYQKTRISNLCLAGGVALNCKMNGELVNMPWVSKMYVQPAANDCGLCLGAAYLGALETGDTPVRMSSVYLGPKLKSEDIENFVTKNGIRAEKITNPAEVAANLISQGYTVAWMQERLEIGPRALGHRSLLGDPRRLDVRDKLNLIKSREYWRPVAPTIIESEKVYCNMNKATEYMTHTVEMNGLAVQEIPAGVHVNRTARVQVVRNKHDLFYDLIKNFEKRTGIPAILNTSLNAKNEPLCTSIDEGVRFFYSTPTDYLIGGGWIIKK